MVLYGKFLFRNSEPGVKGKWEEEAFYVLVQYYASENDDRYC
jgi:hypothetical protein